MIHADNDNDTLSLPLPFPLTHLKEQSSMRLHWSIGLGQAVTMAYAMALMRAGSDAILFLELLSFSNTVAMTMRLSPSKSRSIDGHIWHSCIHVTSDTLWLNAFALNSLNFFFFFTKKNLWKNCHHHRPRMKTLSVYIKFVIKLYTRALRIINIFFYYFYSSSLSLSLTLFLSPCLSLSRSLMCRLITRLCSFAKFN